MTEWQTPAAKSTFYKPIVYRNTVEEVRTYEYVIVGAVIVETRDHVRVRKLTKSGSISKCQI